MGERKEKSHVSFQDYFLNDLHEQRPGQTKNKSYVLTCLKIIGGRLFERYKGLWDYGPYRGIKVNGNKMPAIILPAFYYTGNGLSQCIDLYKSVLVEMKQLSREHDFRLIVLYIPEKAEIYNRFLLNLPEKEREHIDLNRLAVIKATQDMGIEVFDSTFYLLAATRQGEKVYHYFDCHLNKTGYTVLAGSLAKYLESEKK